VRSTAPTGWILAQGQAVTTANAELRTLLLGEGSPFGTDGSGNPLLPDLRGRVPVGVDGAAGRLTTLDALGQAGGAQTVTLTSAQSGMPNHNHGGTGGEGAPDHLHVQNGGRYLIESPGGGYSIPGSATYPNKVGAVTTTGASDRGLGHGHSIPLQAADASQSHNNMQPYLIVNYMVKT
jgi:microcystin-dependent protein